EILEQENLLKNTLAVGQYLIDELKGIPSIKKIKGKGLILGVEFEFPVRDLRNKILFEDFVFTAASANPNLLRILPPLIVTKAENLPFVKLLKKQLKLIKLPK